MQTMCNWNSKQTYMDETFKKSTAEDTMDEKSWTRTMPRNRSYSCISGNNKTSSVLVPSFLRNRSPVFNPKFKQEANQTAWLDGLRGVAAFIVYIRHFAAIHHPQIQCGYGSDPGNRYFVQLPFIRLVTAGPAMVTMFFIISGYALSWGPLKALHKGQADQATSRLASTTFRRALRLYLPGIFLTFLVMLAAWAGLYTLGEIVSQNEELPWGFHEPQPPFILENVSLFTYIFDWLYSIWNWTNIFRVELTNNYNPHLWTLSVEFRCSMELFLMLLAMSRVKSGYRVLGLGLMLVYCYYTGNWAEWLFFAGAFLAQWKFYQSETSTTNASASILPASKKDTLHSPKLAKTSKRRWDYARIFLFILGLYLLSAPDYDYALYTPGYLFIANVLRPTPWYSESWRFPHCIGGFLVVYSLSTTNTNLLRNIFDNPVSRYLGKISYALYLVHGPIIHMLGFWLVPFFWNFTGYETLFGKELGWAIAFGVMTPFVIWMAHLFWRFVDAKSVILAKWFEQKVSDNRP